MKEYRITSNGLIWHIEYLKHYKSFWRRRPQQKWVIIQRSLGYDGYQIDASFYSLGSAQQTLCDIKAQNEADERGFIPVDFKKECP